MVCTGSQSLLLACWILIRTIFCGCYVARVAKLLNILFIFKLFHLPVCAPCRSCGSVEGRLYSVYERQVWHGLQTEDGQVRPDVRLRPVRSVPSFRLATPHLTDRLQYRWRAHTRPKSYISISQSAWSATVQFDSGVRRQRLLPDSSFSQVNTSTKSLPRWTDQNESRLIHFFLEPYLHSVFPLLCMYMCIY